MYGKLRAVGTRGFNSNGFCHVLMGNDGVLECMQGMARNTGTLDASLLQR